MKKVWILIILLIALLNLLDAFLTVNAIKGGAIEFNPLMQYVLDNNFFVEYKVVTSMVICLAYLKIDLPSVRRVLLGVLTLLFLICVYHIIFLQFIMKEAL